MRLPDSGYQLHRLPHDWEARWPKPTPPGGDLEGPEGDKASEQWKADVRAHRGKVCAAIALDEDGFGHGLLALLVPNSLHPEPRYRALRAGTLVVTHHSQGIGHQVARDINGAARRWIDALNGPRYSPVHEWDMVAVEGMFRLWEPALMETGAYGAVEISTCLAELTEGTGRATDIWRGGLFNGFTPAVMSSSLAMIDRRRLVTAVDLPALVDDEAVMAVDVLCSLLSTAYTGLGGWEGR